MKNIFFTLIIFCFVTLSAESQIFKNYFAGIGLSTTKILGDNPNTYTFNGDVFGGSMNEWQPGIDIRLLIPMDENETFRIPIGIDYNFFRAYERYPYYGRAIIYTHSMNVLNFYSGINLTLLRLPYANAKFYVGLEPRFSLVHNISFVRETKFEAPERDDTYEEFPTKDNAFRIGGLFKLGLDGRIKNDLYINASFGVSAMNLLLRDDKRGELFTPETAGQPTENMIGTMNLTIMLQYKFN